MKINLKRSSAMDDKINYVSDMRLISFIAVGAIGVAVISIADLIYMIFNKGIEALTHGLQV
jgi:hypothetical protein